MSLKKLLLAKTDSNASSVTSSDLEMGGVRSVSVYEGNRTRVKKWSGHSNHAYHYRSHSNTSHRKRKKDLLIIAQEEDYEILGGPTQVYLIKGRGRSFEVVDLSDTCLLKGSWGEEPEEERVVQFTDSQGRLLLTMEHSVVGPVSANLTLPRHSSTLANLRQIDNAPTNPLPSPPSFTLTSSILFPHGTVCTFTQATSSNHTPPSSFVLSSSSSIPLGRLIFLSPDETLLLLAPPQQEDPAYSSPLFRLTLIASSLLISKRFPLIHPPNQQPPPLLPTLSPAPLPILLTFLLLFLLGLSLVLYTVISIRFKSPPSAGGGDSSPPKFPQSLKSPSQVVEKGEHHHSLHNE